MKLPRRQPRAVYAVHDAEEFLEQEPTSRKSGVTAEADQKDSLERSSRSTLVVPSSQTRGRMLLGALLCLTGGCAAIVVVLIALRPDGQTIKGAKHSARKRAASVSTRIDRPFTSHTSSTVATTVEVATNVRGHVGMTPQAAALAMHMTSRVPPRAAMKPEIEDDPPAAGPLSGHGQNLAAECDCTAADAEFGFER